MSTQTEEVPIVIPLDDGEHKPGCPKTRVESYDAVQPAKDDRPAKTVTVTRCADCGGHQVRPGDMAAVIKQLQKKGSNNVQQRQRQRPEPDPGAGQHPDPGGKRKEDDPGE